MVRAAALRLRAALGRASRCSAPSTRPATSGADWLSQSNYDGRWREMVQRSVITLKLCTYEPTGAMVAAPTCSLPEGFGGAAQLGLPLRLAARLGLHRLRLPAARLLRGGPALRRLARGALPGDRPRRPRAPDRLRHRRRARPHRARAAPPRGLPPLAPVRIGNGAHDQLQLDVYGELMDAVYLSNKQEPISWELWSSLRRLLDWLADNWQRPDEGIWEVRGGRRHFVYSRLMCWVAFERAMRIQVAARPARQHHQVARGARRDLRGDHDQGVEPRAPRLRAVLRRRRARRQQPADAAGQVHRPARPAHAGDARRDRARPRLGQPRLPLRPR